MSSSPVASGYQTSSLRSRPFYKWIVLATVGMGILTSTVDGSIVNIALPQLGGVFDTDAGTILWVSVAFLLASIGLMLSLGSLGDAIGRKRVFLAGFLIFAIGLAVASAAQTLPQLLTGRIVQGVGVAMILANGNAIVVSAFPPNERGRALGTTSAIVGLGLTIGPPLGGFLLDLWGWRSLFYTRIPFMVLFFVLGMLILQPDGKSARQLRFDFGGAVTLFTFLSMFLLAVNRGPRLGWTDPLIVTLGAISAVSLIAFVFLELRARTPILELSLFRSRMFSLANATNSLHFLSQGAIIILLPFFLLDGRGLSASQAGFILITLPLVRLFVGPFSGFIADKVPSRVISTVGLLVMVAAYLGLRTVGADTPTAFLVTLLLMEGFGTSIFSPATNSAIMGSVPQSNLGTASGMIATVRQVSQAIGIAVAGTMYAVFREGHEADLLAAGLPANAAQAQAVALGFQEVLTVMLVFLLAAVVTSALRGPDRPARHGGTTHATETLGAARHGETASSRGR